MAIVFQEDSESRTVGAAVTTANSSWSTITGTVTYSSTQVASGTKSVAFNNTAIATAAQTVSAITTRYMRRWYYIPSIPTSGLFATLTRLRDSANTTQGEIRVNSSGQLVVRSASAAVATSTGVITAGSWIAFLWSISGTTQTCRFYRLPLATSPSFESLTGAYSGTAVASIVDGNGTASIFTGPLYGDNYLDDDAGYPTLLPAGTGGTTAPAGWSEVRLFNRV